MNRIKLFHFIIVIFFLNSSCDIRDNRLIIKNTCSKTLYFVITNTELDFFDSHLFSLEGTLDTNPYPKRFSNTSLVEIGEISGGSKFWTYYIKNSQDEKLRIYIFDKEVLGKNTWQEVKRGKNYTKKIELSIEELEDNSWIIDLCVPTYIPNVR